MRSPFLFLALLGPLPTSAFFPTKFRDNLSMLPGISHEQMTEEVLTSVVSSLFPPVTESLRVALGVPLSQGMLDARTAIVRSNVWVDQWYPNPTWHWEGDDGESARELADMKAALVKHLVEGNINAARINLGQALHLVQDYFAYRFVSSLVYRKARGLHQLTLAAISSWTTIILSGCGGRIFCCWARMRMMSLRAKTRTTRSPGDLEVSELHLARRY